MLPEDTPTEPTFSSALTVDLLDVMGDDERIVQAMRVSTQGADALGAEAHAGRIRFLMENRHGTPFEHGALQFFVHVPIAVFREWHRHRIGQSYNEESGRYKVLEPVFYVPPPERPLVQVGKPGAYEFVPAAPATHAAAVEVLKGSHREAYRRYLILLDQLGVAKEVARGVLGVHIYSSMIVTMNPRSAMAFLSLRQQFDRPEAMFPSRPMWEIARCADQVEAALAAAFPLTHAAYVAAGRVCP